MRFLFLIFLFFLSLVANDSSKSCYSVQIASFQYTSLEKLKKLSFPKECVIVKKENFYTVRCGCEDKKSVLKKLSFYKKKVPGAFVVKSEKSLFKTVSDENLSKKEAKEPSLTELMYRVFIYSNDLKNAYKIAYEQLKKNPKSLLWRKRVADILLWSGRSKEALDQYFIVYKETKDRKLEKIILKASIENREYEKAYEILRRKLFKRPYDQKLINEFVDVAQKVGKIDKCVKILDLIYKRTKDPKILKRAAFLYYKKGEIKEAKKRFLLLKRAGFLDIKDAVILSEIFFLERDIQKALRTLLEIKDKVSIEDRKYWLMLSSFYEYLNKKEVSMKILLKLCLNGECEREEYNKLIRYYYQKNKEIALKLSQKAFYKFQEPSYFIYYAKTLLETDREKELYKFLFRISSSLKKSMEKLPSFWLVKALMYKKLGKLKKASFCYKKAMNLDENSAEIMISYADFLLSLGKGRELAFVISKMERKAEEKKAFYPILASLYFTLNKPKKALKYYKKALNAYPLNINLKIDYAEFLAVLGYKSESLKNLRKIYRYLKERAKKDPSILNNRKFLIPFLRVSIHFVSDKKYRDFLKFAEKRISKREFQNFKLSYALYKNRNEYFNYLVSKLKDKKVWLKLYLSLEKNEKERLKELLYKYSTVLPLKEKTRAYIKSQNIAKAMESSFEAAEKYPKNREIYKQRYDLSKKYGNKFYTDLGYQKRGDLKLSYLKLENLYYLLNRYYFGSSLEKDRYEYGNLFNEIEAKVWLKVLTQSGFFEAGAGYRSGEDPYKSYFMRLYSKLGNRADAFMEVFKNAKTKESSALLLCGKKDGIKTKLNYKITRKIESSLALEAAKYALRNGKFLGKGYKLSLDFIQKLRLAYPDMAFREFVALSKFKDKDSLYLPRDYAEGGVGFYLGRDFEGSYSYEWRPYMDFSLSKNSLFGFSYAATVGASGGFFGDDNLNISLNYNRSAGDLNEELWFFKLRHSYLY